MRTIITFFLSILTTFVYSQTCDLEFISYNPINHEIEVAFLDATNCGCNDYTLQDGNTCGESISTHVNNNDDVTNLVFGLHYDDFNVMPAEVGCSASTQFHPGWTYVIAYNQDGGWQTGDTAKFSLNPGFGWECILDNPIDTVCWEVVIWQINLSQTVSIDDFPNEYWTDTCGTCANQTQMYPDINISNNSIVFCPGQVFEVYGCMYEDAINYDPLATIDDGSCEYEDCPVYGCTNPVACNYDVNATINDGSCITCDSPYALGLAVCDNWLWYVNLFDDCGVVEECDTVYIELPPDTITEYITFVDTLTIIDVVDSLIFIYDTTYVYDTTYIDNFIYIDVIDTLYLPEYIYDTAYVEVLDTLYLTEYVYDTLYIDNYIYEYDTIYVDVIETDTLYITETEYVVDTLYITEYITLTDTITEYVVQELLIDCNTGLPCEDDPPGLSCPDWTTIHIPNTFTPNNDGINDVWQIIYDLDCWENVEFWVYNRWGGQVYHGYGSSFDGYPYWDGSVNDGNHYVQDGVYVYIVQGKKVGRAEVVKEQGHISVFR